MKTMKEKLWFGYIGASALVSVLTVIVSIWARADWYYYLVTPVYLYTQLLLTGIVLQNWWQIGIAVLSICAPMGGVLLRWKSERKWSSVLIFTPLIMHTVVQFFRVWLTVPHMELSELLVMVPYFSSFVLNCILLCVYWFALGKK